MNLVRQADAALAAGPLHFTVWYVGYILVALEAYRLLFDLSMRVILW